MTDQEGQPTSGKPQEPLPVIPAGRPIVPDYLVEDPLPLVTVRKLPPLEAELARAKLEAEGIRCIIVDQATAVVYPLANTEARLQVRAGDREAAEEILSRPAPADAEGEYAEEDWRCPRCHRKTIELLPLPRGARRLRAVWLLLLMMPLLVLGLCWTVPLKSFVEMVNEVVAYGVLPWIVALMGLGLYLVFIRRGKRCTECGWQSGT